MIARRLQYLSLTVSDLKKAEAFYIKALGFSCVTKSIKTSQAFAHLLGVRNIQSVLLQRGKQRLELLTCDPPGAPYPSKGFSNDRWFQHCALVTEDIARDYDRLAAHNITPITEGGPRRLPGGIRAFKFRDSDGHPLEFIQFPERNMATTGGIDHSAIVVKDAERSIAFYGKVLGLSVKSHQVNSGPAQDDLDNLKNTHVEVIAMAPVMTSPHVELLCYRAPQSARKLDVHPSDIASSRLVFKVDDLAGLQAATTLEDGTTATLLHDPDGHALVLTTGG